MQHIAPEKLALLNIGKINGWIESSQFALLMRYSLAKLAFTQQIIDENHGQLPVTESRFITAFIKPTKVREDFLDAIASLHRQIFSQKETYNYQPGEWRSQDKQKALQRLLVKHNSKDNIFESAIQLYQNFLQISPFHKGNELVADLIANMYLVERSVLLAPILIFSRMQNNTHDPNQQVAEQTELIISLLHNIRTLDGKYKERTNGFAKQRKDLFQGLLPCMMEKPQFTIKELQNSYQEKSTYQTINELFKELVKLNVLKEVTGKDRHRVFHLHEYTQLFKPLI